MLVVYSNFWGQEDVCSHLSWLNLCYLHSSWRHTSHVTASDEIIPHQIMVSFRNHTSLKGLRGSTTTSKWHWALVRAGWNNLLVGSLCFTCDGLGWNFIDCYVSKAQLKAFLFLTQLVVFIKGSFICSVIECIK